MHRKMAAIIGRARLYDFELFHSVRVIVVCVSVLIAACNDTASRTPTSPSEVVAFIHNTMNAPDNRVSSRVTYSYLAPFQPGFTGFVARRAFDDFTSAETTAIRTVSWQGGYCRGGLPGQGPVPPPAAPSSIRFQVGLYPDDNGRPNEFGPLYEVMLTPSEAHEQLTFDTGPTEGGCSVEAPNASYYDYSAVLPTPLPVTAGVRYWLMVRADIGDSAVPWGWRIGTQDNNYSALSGPLGALLTAPVDLAFSLSVR
jgi:hypothetical protein